MGVRFLGSVSVCLVAVGMAFADEPRLPSQTPTPAIRQDSKPDDEKPTLPELLRTMPGQANQTAPISSASTPTACDTESKSAVATPDLSDDHIGPGNTMWASLEYLYWWSKEGPLPVPLVVSASGQVIGNGDFTYDDRPGGRLTIGTWLDVPHHFGIEASGILISRNRVSATLASDSGGNPAIFRPFINVAPQDPVSASYLVSLPAVYAGSATVTSLSRFWGAEANIIRNIISNYDCELDLLLGFRYLDVDENLNIDQQTTIVGNGNIFFNNVSPTSGVLTLSDQFATRNNLLLGQVGGRASMIRGPLTLDFLCKVGFGPNLEQVRINGTSQFAAGSFFDTAAGGLLALPGTNIGRTRTSWFSIVPEVGARIGWNVTSFLNLHVGYSFLYLNSVVRPGDQINVRVNPAFIPTSNTFGSLSAPAEPAPLFRQTDYWVHGITAGVTLRY